MPNIVILNPLRELFIRKSYKTFFFNTSWIFSERILRMLVGLFVGVWVARYLGPDQFGILNYAQSFVSIFVIIAALGLDGIISRNIVREIKDKDAILGTAFLLKLISGMVVFALLYLIMHYFYSNNQVLKIVTMIIAIEIFLRAADIIKAWFDSQLQSKYAVYAQILSLLIIAVIKVILILRKATIIAFAIAIVAEVFLLSVAYFIIYRITSDTFAKWRISFRIAKSMFEDSWPLVLAGMLVFINMHIDKIMIGIFNNNSEVGIYSAAMVISSAWYFLVTAISISITPNLIQKIKYGYELYRNNLQKVFTLLTYLAISIALPISVLSKYIIHIIYGEAYLRSAPVLMIHIWSLIFIYHVSIRKKSFVIEGNSKLVFIYSILTVLFKIILNMMLIPYYGAVGASVAFLFSWIFSVVFIPLFSKETQQQVPMFFRSFNPLNLLRG